MASIIRNDLEAFISALNSKAKIHCNKRGGWYKAGFRERFLSWLPGYEDTRVIQIAKIFIQVLDKLETVPVKVHVSGQEKKEQERKYLAHIKASNLIKAKLEAHKSVLAKKTLRKLNQRVIALEYRMERAKRDRDQGQFECLLKLALNWKNNYPLYRKKEIVDCEKEKLMQACVYPEFVRLLLVDKQLCCQFFKWSLRDNCPVSAFIEFPSTSNRLKVAFLAGRIGRFAKDLPLIKFKERGQRLFLRRSQIKTNCPYEKHYVLPFEVQKSERLQVEEISILDKTQVVNLRHHYKLTIEKIIHTFSCRNKTPGNLEMLGKRYLDENQFLGPRIANHNSYEIGPYNPGKLDFERPDFSRPNTHWWKQVAPLDTLDAKEIKEMYGVDSFKQNQWLVAVRASREDPGMDVDKSHGFIDVLIPIGENRFSLFPFGKYAANWPSTFLEKAFFVTNTVKSKIECPDENHYMSQRQQALVTHVIEQKEGQQLMELIRQDLVKAQQGNIIFQFTWENCAWWCQKLIEKILGSKKYGGAIPNYFRSHLLDAEPKIQPLTFIFKMCRKIRGKLQEIVVKIIEFLLLSWRKITIFEKGRKRVKSVSTSSHMKRLEVFHPSNLHKKILDKSVNGTVYIGPLLAQN